MTKTTYLLTFSCFFFSQWQLSAEIFSKKKNKNPFLNISKDRENNVTN